VQLRQHAFQQQALAFRWRMVMAGQAPPGAHALHAAVVQQVLQQRIPEARCKRGQGAALQAPLSTPGSSGRRSCHPRSEAITCSRSACQCGQG
jgi:hypothetical protein